MARMDRHPVTDDVLKEVTLIAADVLRVPRATITPATSPGDIEAWDSIRNVNIVMSVEERFAIQFDADELDAMTTIGKIVETVARKLARAA